ncbi:MAG: hypothetical protein JKY11_09395 [Alphaproteobacteria bacterium]|nr:hypothetical protein [Alphaproteobacteria bacterium]
MNEYKQQEQGNVLIIILITIALFAALYFTFTKSSNTGASGIMSDGQAKLATSEILKFSHDVERGWSKLIQNGCSESEISSVGDWSKGGYTNPLSPADNSCHLFHEDGANVETMEVPDGVQTTTGWWAGWWLTKINTDSLGNNTCQDQFLIMRYVNDTVCKEINQSLGHNFTNIPADGHFGGGDWALRTAFQCSGVGGAFDEANLVNKRSFCYDSTYGYNIYVHLLHER